jgi:hypothetical protein
LSGHPLHHGGELPREVHGVADARVHPLAADRAVNVCGISEQEGSPHLEARRHTVMDMIG